MHLPWFRGQGKLHHPGENCRCAERLKLLVLGHTRPRFHLLLNSLCLLLQFAGTASNGSSKASLVQQGASRSFAFGRPGLRSLRAPSVPSQKPMHCLCTSGLLPSQRNLKWRLTARCFRESSAELRSASRGWGIVMFRIVAGTWSSLALVVALWSWWDDLGRRLAVCGGCQPLSETSLMITREMPPSAQTFGMPTRARNHKHERGMQIPAAAIA